MLDLDLYTDTVAMQPRLQALPALERARIRSTSVMHATRRAPRRNPASRACRIAVCYAVDTGEAAPRILYGKVYPSEVCAELAARADASAASAWLPDIDMLLWQFPRDPGLPQLGALLDDATELVRYRPEERATLRRHERRTGAVAVYAKTFRGDEGAELCERFAALGRGSAHAEAFDVAPPLRYDPALRTYWQLGVEGPALSAILNERNCAALMERAARGLARLHNSAARFGSLRRIEDLAAAAVRRGAKVARCMPELGEAAQHVAAALAARRPHSTPVAQIHGDFHLDQLRLCGDRLMLFDLDELAIGDPLEDLASFMVKCEDTPLALRAGDALIDAYARCRPAAFAERRLAWHLAVQWLLKASRAYVWQRPGWRAAAARMVAQAERCAAELQARPS